MRDNQLLLCLQAPCSAHLRPHSAMSLLFFQSQVLPVLLMPKHTVLSFMQCRWIPAQPLWCCEAPFTWDLRKQVHLSQKSRGTCTFRAMIQKCKWNQSCVVWHNEKLMILRIKNNHYPLMFSLLILWYELIDPFSSVYDLLTGPLLKAFLQILLSSQVGSFPI